MKALRWLARWARGAPWYTGAQPDADTVPRSAPQPIDIDLSGFDDVAGGTGESTDYDVHSLGEPIDPARADAAGRRSGR